VGDDACNRIEPGGLYVFPVSSNETGRIEKKSDELKANDLKTQSKNKSLGSGKVRVKSEEFEREAIAVSV
jgi:hypothetical protein